MQPQASGDTGLDDGSGCSRVDHRSHRDRAGDRLPTRDEDRLNCLGTAIRTSTIGPIDCRLGTATVNDGT